MPESVLTRFQRKPVERLGGRSIAAVPQRRQHRVVDTLGGGHQFVAFEAAAGLLLSNSPRSACFGRRDRRAQTAGMRLPSVVRRLMAHPNALASPAFVLRAATGRMRRS